MAPLIALEQVFRASLLVIVACYGILVIGFATWLFNGNKRGQSAGLAGPQRNAAKRRGESYPLNCTTARPSTGATNAAHRVTEPSAEPLPPRLHHRQALPAASVSTDAQALERHSRAQCCSSAPLTPGVDGSCRTSSHSTNKQPAPRSLAAPRQIASEPPLEPEADRIRPGTASRIQELTHGFQEWSTMDSKKSIPRSIARNVSASTSEPSLLVERTAPRQRPSSRQAMVTSGSELTASKAPRQRPAGSQPTTRRRSDVSSGDNSSMRRQLSLSSASRFYAEVVNRQAALHRVGSKSFPTLAKDIPPNMCMDMRSSSY